MLVWRAGEVSVQIVQVVLSEAGNLDKCFGCAGCFIPNILP